MHVPFGIVITFYFTLYRIRDRLNRPDTVKTYGFLYVGYRPAWYRYKILVLLRQLGVVASTMIWSQGTTSSKLSQSLGCLMTIFIAMTIHFFADPQESAFGSIRVRGYFHLLREYLLWFDFPDGKSVRKIRRFSVLVQRRSHFRRRVYLLIYITMEVTPFAVKAAKGSKGISGVLFGDIKKFDTKENKKTTRKNWRNWINAYRRRFQLKMKSRNRWRRALLCTDE